MTNELANRIAREKDKFLFELFKKYGYHRGKVMKLLRKNRISMTVQGDLETYFVDDKKLFTIRKVVKFDDENYRVTFYFTEVLDNVSDKVQGSEQEPVETREHD